MEWDTFDGLIFDCDGTLANTMPLHWESWQIVSQKYGFLFTEKTFYALGGVPSQKILEDISRDQSISFTPSEVAKEKESAYLDLIGTVKPIEKVVQIAKDNFGKKPMAVASGGTADVVSSVLKHLDLLPLFDAIVTCEDVHHQKPAPDIFLKAAALIGTAPEKCVGFEDSSLGIQSIMSAGMKAIHVDDITEFAS